MLQYWKCSLLQQPKSLNLPKLVRKYKNSASNFFHKALQSSSWFSFVFLSNKCSCCITFNNVVKRGSPVCCKNAEACKCTIMSGIRFIPLLFSYVVAAFHDWLSHFLQIFAVNTDSMPPSRYFPKQQVITFFRWSSPMPRKILLNLFVCRRWIPFTVYLSVPFAKERPGNWSWWYKVYPLKFRDMG